jgi:hypothetical protein
MAHQVKKKKKRKKIVPEELLFKKVVHPGVIRFFLIFIFLY